MMKTIATVREAVESDLLAILAIYNEVIATSTTVYTLEPSTIEDRRMWFSSRCASGFPVLVATSSGSNDILGFASFGDW
jgi:phosphinothricin acetyltransferase